MNDKNFKIIIALAIVAIVSVVGVGVAAFTTNLTINGVAKVNASSWKIKFTNLSSANLVGTAEETKTPTISNEDTHIGDYNVNFTTPGDSVTYTFDVVNEGTFNSKISSIVLGTPTCTGTGDNATTDAANVCKNLAYSLTYTDSGTPVSKDDTLLAGTTKHLTLKLTYNPDTTVAELPTNDVSVSGLATTIIYSQD